VTGSSIVTGMPHAIVTGVSRGLGEQVALALLRRGYAVTGIGRTDSSLLSGDAYRFVACDLALSERVEAQVEPVFRAIAASRPASVCLFNNAAVASPVGSIGRVDGAEFARSIALNLIAPVLLANVFCRVFTEDGLERRLINVSSGAAEMALPGAGAYCVSKSALEMLTRVLAAEQRKPSFCAITLRPGIIDTGMQEFMRTRSRNDLPGVGLFDGFWKGGQLVASDVAAEKIVRRVITAPVEHGRTYNYREL
jgi:benzil reductase ((S)-benzoin forming)